MIRRGMFGNTKTYCLIGDGCCVMAVPRQKIAFRFDEPRRLMHWVKFWEVQIDALVPVADKDAVRLVGGLMHQCHYVLPGGKGLANGGDLSRCIRVERIHAFGVFRQVQRLVMEQLGQRHIKRRGILAGGRQRLLKMLSCQRNAFLPRRRFFPRQVRRACRHSLLFRSEFPLMARY